MFFSISRLSFTVFLVARFAASEEIRSGSQSNLLSDVVIPLTGGSWTLWSDDQVFTNLKASVPGDILSDLMINGLIDDPYMDRNFLTQNKVWMGNDGDDDENKLTRKRNRTWIYSTTFDIPESASRDMSWKIVLEGIKMGADISVNGQWIGQTIDQFLRYDLEIRKEVLEKGVLCGRNLHRHNLTISFDPSIRTNGRFSGMYKVKFPNQFFQRENNLKLVLFL